MQPDAARPLLLLRSWCCSSCSAAGVHPRL